MFEDLEIINTFICGSEEQLERVTNLALQVWYPYLLGHYDQCMIRYKSVEALPPELYVQVQCGLMSKNTVESGPKNLEQLCYFIYSKNKFSGTHYQYLGGKLDDPSNYNKIANFISYFFSRYASVIPNPLEVASAVEELKDWLLSQDKDVKLADYLPPE